MVVGWWASSRPSTDRAVITQLVAVAARLADLALPARRRHLLGLWAGSSTFVMSLFVLRASH